MPDGLFINTIVEANQNVEHNLAMLIDSHCHLEKAFHKGNLNELLENAAESGVSQMITVGTSLKDWPLYHRLARENPGRIFWTAGIHPCAVDETWDEQVKTLPSYFATDPLPVALGEIGLDYFHLPKYPDEIAEVKHQQVHAFRAQLALAYQFDCPVVIHSRGAFADCVRMIDESGVAWERVVFHCFSEGPEAMQQILDRGGFASFTGIITYKSAANVRESMKLQGADRLMLETDAPYLSPEPHRGQANEPAYVTLIARRAALEFGLSEQELMNHARRRTLSFFQIEE